MTPASPAAPVSTGPTGSIGSSTGPTPPPRPPTPGRSRRRTLALAAVLALGAAVSLGLSRFSYALLLPPMQADLGWSWLGAGVLNTFNAAGYLLGAFGAAGALRRRPARTLFLLGMAYTGLFLVAHGFFVEGPHLAVLRVASGAAAAATFVSGGLLAARLVPAAAEAGAAPASLVLGIYYGGTGIGILAATAIVPPLAGRAVPHAWQDAWIALGLLAVVLAVVAHVATRRAGLAEPEPADAGDAPFARRRLAFALFAYFAFGLGYIGYMTFIVSLLRGEGVGEATVLGFYALLGAACVAGSWLWAPLLRAFRGGGAMAVLCALLAVATLLPVLGAQPAAVFASALLFGGVFLSVVASTTALVRHNLAPAQWGRGIAAFTVVFAVGQIVGPSLVGAVADASGGLRAGLAVSAGVLAVAAIAASLQRPLPSPRESIR